MMTDAQIVMSILSSSWAFDSLPDTCKAIFKNFYWERKSMDEIADILYNEHFMGLAI